MNYVARIQEVTRLRCPKNVEVKRPTPTGVITTFEHRPWEVLTYRDTKSTFEVALIVPTGYSTLDLQQETDAIYAACGKHISIKDRGGISVVIIAKIDMPTSIPFDSSMLDLTKGREVLVGYDLAGKPITHNFRVPHVLIGATTGYGKTDLLRFWIYQLISRFTPDQLHIHIVDLKGYSFLPFRNIPHITIVRDLAGARKVMTDGVRTMRTRSNSIFENGGRDEQTASFRWELIIVDELYIISPEHQITKDAKNMAEETYAAMAEISCVGREASVGVIISTQRPDASTIHPQVKQNCDVAIAFKCKTNTNSEIILGKPGAELLPQGIPGRAIYSGISDCTIQVPYVGKDNVWEELLNPFRKEVTQNEQTEASNDIDLNDL